MIHAVPEIGSTNAELAAWLRAGEDIPEGFWLVADRQSAGKGRQGRAWFDGAGNFMGSTVVHLRPVDPPPSSLALVAGLAVQAAVSRYIPAETPPQLKWPNDVLVDGAKLSGVLLQAQGKSVVIGVGVNIKIAPRLLDRQTAALAQWGNAPERDVFAEVLAAEFAAALDAWRHDGLAAIIARWNAAAHPLGTPLQVGEPGEEPLSGTFAGLAADGALQLALTDGTTRVIHAGEVSLTPDI